MKTRNDFLVDFMAKHKDLATAIDAVGYFFCNWGDDSVISDPYGLRLTDSRETAEDLYLLCSESLYNAEFSVSGALDENDKTVLLDICTDLQEKINAILD